MSENKNCHGCKWLDEVKKKGSGYCAMVVRSKGYKNGDRVRTTKSTACELYEAGEFATRFNKE